MQIIVGLGNPGTEYAKTRHNFGFLALDALQAELGLPAFRLETKFKAEITSSGTGEERLILVKPQTYMNLSGESVQAILAYHKATPASLTLVYDDKDLPYGTLRLRSAGGHGGHNGVRSVIEHLSTEEFARVRLGVGSELLTHTPTDRFVLGSFSAAEQEALPALLSTAVAALQCAKTHGFAVAMDRYNTGLDKTPDPA
jgi:PTH1 family peptidyl-tRNA hydrolase